MLGLSGRMPEVRPGPARTCCICILVYICYKKERHYEEMIESPGSPTRPNSIDKNGRAKAWNASARPNRCLCPDTPVYKFEDLLCCFSTSTRITFSSVKDRIHPRCGWCFSDFFVECLLQFVNSYVLELAKNILPTLVRRNRYVKVY